MNREQLKRELQEDYGITVQFDEAGNPILRFEDKVMIVNALAPDYAPSFLDYKADSLTGIVSVSCVNPLIKQKFLGVCFIGSPLGNGKKVEDVDKAKEVACSRALRRYCKAINFDPVVAHFNARAGQAFSPTLEAITAQEDQSRKAIHALRDRLDLDETTYRHYLAFATSTADVPGKTSTKSMSLDEMILARTYLAGIEEGIIAARRKLAA